MSTNNGMIDQIKEDLVIFKSKIKNYANALLSTMSGHRFTNDEHVMMILDDWYFEEIEMAYVDESGTLWCRFVFHDDARHEDIDLDDLPLECLIDLVETLENVEQSIELED